MECRYVVSGPAPQTIIEIDEYASWPSSDNLVDGTTDSHLSPNYPKLD